MPTGIERVSPGLYADNLIAGGTHQRAEDGAALRRLSFPAKILVQSKAGVKQGKRKQRRAVGMTAGLPM